MANRPDPAAPLQFQAIAPTEPEPTLPPSTPTPRPLGSNAAPVDNSAPDFPPPSPAAPKGAKGRGRPKKDKTAAAEKPTAPLGAKNANRSGGNLYQFAPKGAKADNPPTLPREQSAREQDKEWLKSILPPEKNGWYQLDENGKGWTIKLRWRVKGDPKQHVYLWRRLSKKDFATLRSLDEQEQRRTMASRIFGELLREGRRDVALRLTPYTPVDQRLSAANS